MQQSVSGHSYYFFRSPNYNTPVFGSNVYTYMFLTDNLCNLLGKHAYCFFSVVHNISRMTLEMRSLVKISPYSMLGVPFHSCISNTAFMCAVVCLFVCTVSWKCVCLGERLGRVLEWVGVRMSDLSESAVRSVQSVAGTAAALGTRDCSDSR